MSKERFTLTPSTNSMWTVSDSETGFAITFREGLFNETQEVKNPETLPQVEDLASWAARAMSAIGDYMAQEHPYVSSCDIYARRSALWMLSHESWWVTIVAACNSLMISEDDEDLATQLFMELDDFFNLSHENPADLQENEKSNLLGAISLLDEDEALEVFRIIHTFWHEYTDHNISIDTWARDLLWWPAWANTVIDKLEAEEDGDN